MSYNVIKYTLFIDDYHKTYSLSNEWLNMNTLKVSHIIFWLENCKYSSIIDFSYWLIVLFLTFIQHRHKSVAICVIVYDYNVELGYVHLEEFIIF